MALNKLSSAVGAALALSGTACLAEDSAAFVPSAAGAAADAGARPLRAAGNIRSADVGSEEHADGATGKLGMMGSGALISAAILARRRQKTGSFAQNSSASGKMRVEACSSSCSTALAAFESELGVQAPVGFFDPLGFTKDGDVTKFKRRRQVELKHGRVAMLAAMGYITPEYFRFPGSLSTSLNLSFDDMPNGLAALSKMPVAGGLQWFFFCGALERGLFQQDPSRDPGDFQNIGNLGVPYSEDVQDPEARKRGLNSELANGRLAMVAIMGMIFQNGTFGTTDPIMWLPGGAFENETGVQPPVGFFDPLGFCKDGDADAFYRRRCTEIKHGRVAMIAAMGYITPEYFRFEGYCSPSEGLEFSDIPNGLAALSKVPVGGWLQWFLFCGFCEVYAAKQDPNDAPGKLSGNDEGFGRATYGNLGLFRADGISDPAKQKRGLNSELANGRLAMFAIMGMMFQNGVTGTTGPEMWFP